MNYDYKYLTPFKWFILENFPFIEADFDALTNWQLFCKLGKEMNKIIDSTNLTGEQVENLTNAFNELKNYVDTYFENLDVQDEIDNKLDEMVEDGTLTAIIQAYLEIASILAYDNLESLKNADNLINGSFVKTYGTLSYNDGLGNFYKIREKSLEDIIDNINIIELTNYNNLVAELIPNLYREHLEHQNIEMNRIFRIVEDYQFQGACQFNSNIVLVGYKDNLSKAKIVTSDGTLINEYSLQNNTHCNSIVFNSIENMFYIANGDGTIDKYNTSFVFQERITITGLYSLSYYNSVMYGLTNENKIYNFKNNEYIDLETQITATKQSFTIHNNKIYAVNSYDNNIYCFAMNGKLLRITHLQDGNGLFPYGECEEIFKFNNKIYMNTICYASQSWRQDFLNQVWETNIDNNINISGLDPVFNTNLYVDATLRNNPTGYQNNAFNYLSEMSIIYNYRKQVIGQITITDFIGSNRLFGKFNVSLVNNSNKEINFNIYNSNLVLKNNNNANSIYTGNIYFSNIKCAGYCHFNANIETGSVLLSDASICSNATFKYCDIKITNNQNHVFTATNCTFNPITIIDPTVENTVLKAILSMNFVRPYAITFMMSGSTYDSLTVQINSSRHSSLNSTSGLNIPTSRGNIILKPTGITQDANVYCYGINVER